MTVILVSHSMEDIARLVERVIVMYKGRIVMDGPVEEVFSDIAKLEGMGLSAPQVAKLMKGLKALNPEIDDRKYTVRAAMEELLKHLKPGVQGQ